MASGLTPVMSVAELRAFFVEAFPQALGPSGDETDIEEITPGRVLVRRKVSDVNLRPGGTVSGPTMMALAEKGCNELFAAQKAALG